MNAVRLSTPADPMTALAPPRRTAAISFATIAAAVAVACGSSTTPPLDNGPLDNGGESPAGESSSGGRPSGGGTSSDGGSLAGGTSSDGGSPGGGTSSGGGSLAGGTSSDGGSSPDAMPYANVVAVEVSGSENAYSFAVSIESSDVDCDQFANWWEVLSEEGELIYRRILLHSHTDENGTTDAGKVGNTFTRSSDSPIDISREQTVLVRAHIKPRGYHGSVMRGSAAQGFEPAPEIGDDFALEVAEQEPLSTECLY